MKHLKLLSLALIAFTALTSTACGDDDDDNLDNSNIPAACKESFSKLYPAATGTEWEVKAPYYVADFKTANSTIEAEAWFKADGTWTMTEEDLGKNLFLVDTAVNISHEKSEYRNWTIDEILYYTYPDATKNFYIIEVEKAANPDTDIYYRHDGTLIKTVTHSTADITPDTVI